LIDGTPREGTASFLAAPGDTYTATLRAFVPKGSSLARSDGAVPGPDRFRTSMPVDMVGYLPSPQLHPGAVVENSDDDEDDDESPVFAAPLDAAAAARAALPVLDRAARPLYAGAVGVFHSGAFGGAALAHWAAPWLAAWLLMLPIVNVMAPHLHRPMAALRHEALRRCP